MKSAAARRGTARAAQRSAARRRELRAPKPVA